MLEIEIHLLHVQHTPELLALWQAEDGLVLRAEDDSEFAISQFIARNEGFCLGAWRGDQLVGAVLTGYDGRRAYLYHVVVAPAHRRQGIGRRLAEDLMVRLEAAGVRKAHLYVKHGNDVATRFWRELGWYAREDIQMYSIDIPGRVR